MTVRPFVKPCAEFDIYAERKSGPIKVLFLAEAPPGSSKGYFYDPLPHPGYKEILRKSLFELLEITGSDTEAKLVHFEARGYFLADAVKCRCKKTGGQPPTPVTRTCGRKWLPEELQELGKPRRICILGRSALLALSQVQGFEELADHSVIEDCGEVIPAAWAEVLIWPFLGWRNQRRYAAHLPVFRSFCYVDAKPPSQSAPARDRVLDRLVSEAKETVEYFSEAMKRDRERATCAALLRCLGVVFTPDEIVPSKREPPDVLFRGAQFEVREFLDKDRRRHDEWRKERERRVRAESLDKLLQPRFSPVPLTHTDIVSLIGQGLAEKLSRYGKQVCSGLDALVYVNLRNSFLDAASEVPDLSDLKEQGWRSVSLLIPPHGHVLYAADSAPNFLRNLVCQTKAEAVNDIDGLFTV